MDFELSEDQLALQAGMASLCRGRFDMAAVRALEASGGVEPARWQELADTGVFGLTLADEAGGAGLGWADAVIVYEQLGRALVPGPLADTLVAAPLVDGAGSGAAVVGLAPRVPGPAVIEYLDSVDVVLVLDGDGVSALARSEIDGVALERPLDPLTPVSRVERIPAGEPVAGPEVAADVMLRATLLVAASELGVAAGATELAVAYAKERHQFGRPIGEFQAVKHLCADMASRVEVARAAVYTAGVVLDDPELGDPARAVAVARLLSRSAAGTNGVECVQVHGGMGWTWEVDAHLYLKRAWALGTRFESADDLAHRMADHA